MNQMNVPGMNPPVGPNVGGAPMINNGLTVPRTDGNATNIPEAMINNLNTYIYDYFLKRGNYDCARALVQDESIKLNTDPSMKASPRRRDGDMNIGEADSMMADNKDGEKLKIPDDLPRPSLASESQQSSFLLDWFSLFWDFFWAQRRKGNSSDVRQYITHTQNMMRLREQQNNHLLRQQPMMPGQMTPLNMRRNGMIPANLQKAALQNNTPGFPQQHLAQLQKNQQMQMMQMQRDHPEIDMNGHRPQSPASAENAPSPSKRQRLEGPPMNGQQLVPNGRGQAQGMAGPPNPQAQALFTQNGISPRGMNPAQLSTFQQGHPAAQQKPMQVYAHNLALQQSRSVLNNQAMQNGLMNPGVMASQADLMPMGDGQGMYLNAGEYYGPNSQMAQVRPGGMQTPSGQHGTHALQDYQMQLMLLEQQNKRRLMMARQEQDSMARPDVQPSMPGQQLPPGTSPQGSRAGTSPNPADQMKRNTPKMPPTGLPGSPSAGDAMAQSRGSPASMNFNGQLGPDIASTLFANGMRPPSSNPTFPGNQMGPGAPGNRMPSGNWQPPQGPGQPMMPQQSAQQPPSGTPQERGTMPPPQPPPINAGNTGRAQPPSPQTGSAAPPTPQQANKPGPKSKKEPKEGRKRPSKKTATAAAGSTNLVATSTEADHPPTPTPSTPITPQHPNSFHKAGVSVASNIPQQPTSAPAPQPLVQQPPDQGQQSFSDLGIPDASAFNLDFSALENPDLLENFDFDTFLNTDGDTAGFGFDTGMPYTDSVEANTAEGL